MMPAAQPPRGARRLPWRRLGLQQSTYVAVVSLTATLMVSFIWWRLSAQRTRIEQYWGGLITGGAQTTRVRAEEWVEAQQRSAAVLAVLASREHRPGGAFEAAFGEVSAEGDIAFVSIRDQTGVVRCMGVPLERECIPGSGAFAPPSESHPQARRVRPAGGGRTLIPAVADIPGRDGTATGVLTLWLDPERNLIPRLLLTAQRPVEGARVIFVSRDSDSATVFATAYDGTVLPRARTAIKDLPPLLAEAASDNDWVRGAGPGGITMLAARAYVPALRWEVFRAIPYSEAAAPFRREMVTESILAFLLGSLVIGTLVWTVRGRREQRVRAELMQARLESLQAQLRPHFLFNALSTIATLIHEDPDAADTMLVRLADLLRLSLEHSDDAEIPLHREVEILDAYLAVERVRFGDKLRVTKQVAADAQEVFVPRWILQPLAENAIKHGAAYSRGQAGLDLRVERRAGWIEIVLADDGPNPVGPEPTEGVGLRNTRKRLDSLYGGDATMDLRRRPGGGTEAVLRIPVRDDLLRGGYGWHSEPVREPLPQPTEPIHKQPGFTGA